MRLKAGNLSWMLVKSFSATESKNMLDVCGCFLKKNIIDSKAENLEM
jgi:hypothetical protein